MTEHAGPERAGTIRNLFGMEIVVAGEVEWAKIVAEAKAAGGVEIGDATRDDYEIVFNEKAGIMFINPAKGAEIMARIRAAIPEAPHA